MSSDRFGPASMPRGPRPGARSRRRSLLRAGLLAIPVLEVVVIVLVARAIGGWLTVALLLAVSGLGGWVVRHEGARAWRDLRHAVASGRMPARELSDAALVVAGGVLLLIPGFITAVIGAVVVLPWTRPLARRLLGHFITYRVIGTGWNNGWTENHGGGAVLRGHVVREHEQPPDEPDGPPGADRRIDP